MPRAGAGGVHARGRRASVVPIGNIQKINRLKFGLQISDVPCIEHIPSRVLHAVFRREINIRLRGDHSFKKGIQLGISSICEEHRAGLGIQRLNMTNPIVFLGWPS